MELKNRGFIYTPPPAKQWVFGGVSGVTDRKILRSNGQWLDDLPIFEPQSNTYFDAMNCVSMSADNTLEILAKVSGINLNISDRHVAECSNTTHQGNSFYNVWESISKLYGIVPESRWPFTPDIRTWEAFYANIPKDIIDEGKKSLETLKIRYEFVPDDKNSMCESLQYAPVQSAIWAYPNQDKNGVYVATNNPANHAIVVIGYEYGKFWYIFDSYEDSKETHVGQIKKITWKTPFWGAILPTIVSFTDNLATMTLQEKVIYQLVEGAGGFFSRIGENIFKLSNAEDFEAIRLRFPTANVQTMDKGVQTVQIPHYQTATLKDMSGIKYKNMKGELIGEFASLGSEGAEEAPVE
jgi:hypothetical protein